MRIALIGNPNSGKTTMYNALTGRKEKTGNWAGVTVDSKESPVRSQFCSGAEDCVAVDLPGAYSMSPFTSEESITSSYVLNEKPDVIINIVDASNLSRSLFFTTQILELGIPVAVALNKSDINEKNNTQIDEALLSEKLGCPVVKTAAASQKGLKELMDTASSLVGKEQMAPFNPGQIDKDSREQVIASDRKRFAWVNTLVAKVEIREEQTKDQALTDAIDAALTNPVLGILSFAAVMFLVFYISQSTLGTMLSELLAGWIDTFGGWVDGLMAEGSPLLRSLILDGIIGGVGAVVGFLPLVMILYFLIALLEDCGYMSRATVVLDPIFKKVGLSGKAVIPMIMGTGCGIPAVMACRTIRNDRERRAAAMLATFMPCGAKLPVIALFAGMFFPGEKWVGPLMYFVGVLLILLGALLVRAVTDVKAGKSYFIIELPDYKLPDIRLAFGAMLSQGKAYILKAGTIILVCNTAVHLMQSFTPALKLVEEGMEHTSILAIIAQPFAVLLVPVVGMAAWQLAAAAVAGFIAKENVVGTLATVYALTSYIDTEELALISGGSEAAAVMGLTKAAALGYLMFNLFSPPCFAAIGAMRAELQSKTWLLAAVAMQLCFGFVVGFLAYQVGTLLTTGALGAGFGAGLAAIGAFAAVAALLIIRARRSVNKETEKVMA
ncbi:MAG: ferrous iron transporter B [Lachnospiraceae bacterium]|nr:ferrous iron transporter B [Lachnospiraceae bacterium]